MKFIPLSDEQSNDPVLIEDVAYVYLNSYSKVITEAELDYIDSYSTKVFKAKDTDSFKEVVDDAFENVTGNKDISVAGYFYFVRSLTRDNIITLTFAEFPYFKDLVHNYAPLSNAARLRSYAIERS